MKCEFIAVGTELLMGQILNTNAKFIAEELAELGIDMHFQTVVGDNEVRLIKAISHGFTRADILILSGGLGPTNDDITKEVAAKAMGVELVLDQPSLNAIKVYFDKIDRPYNEVIQIKQAYMPKDSKILKNDNGTAPGCIIEKNEKTVIVLPGPPREIKPMFLNYVKPYLQSISNGMLYSRVIKIFGMGEASVEEIFGEYMKISTNPTIAPYAKEGETTLRVTAKCNDATEGKNLVEAQIEIIKGKLGRVIYSTTDERLEEVVVKLLQQKGMTISFAESCTGGLLSKMITDVPGSSDVFKEGIVTYSNQAKVKYLGVSEETLAEHGAVSYETAFKMAAGLRMASGADIAVAVTGIAGPSGGTAEKPVGLVYVGVSHGEKLEVKKLDLFGDREKIRYLTYLNVMDIVRRILTWGEF